MSSIQDIVGLIEALYSPNPAVDVNQIQHSLQSVQKSNDGFRLANQLLIDPSYSANVKYFGALTLTVQLNVNVDSHQTLWSLFKANLMHFTRLCGQYTSDHRTYGSLFITIKKLMSNLSLIFVNINESENPASEEFLILKQWNNPVNTFINLFSNFGSNPTFASNWTNLEDTSIDQLLQQSINCTISYDTLFKFISTSPTFNELSLTFTEIIIEDLTKFQSKKHSVSHVHEMVHEYLYISTMALLNINLTLQVNASTTKLQVSDSVFNCATAWINYISMTRNMSSNSSMDLSEIFQNLINLMYQSTEQTDNFYIAEKILTVLGNVFVNDPTLMSFDLRQQIEVLFLGISRVSNSNVDTSKNAWMLQYMHHLVSNEMTAELKDLAVCIVDYLQISNLDVCNKLFTTIHSKDTSVPQEYIKVLLQMTNFPLIPVFQESFSVRMVDFWLDLADSYSNLPSETLLPNSTQISIDLFQQVINIYLPKISLEHKQKIMEEDDGDGSSIHEFDDFRSAVSDLSQSLWTILGNEYLTNILVAGVGASDASNLPEDSKMSSFFQIETMAFLANCLMTDMSLSDSPWITNILNKNIFFIRNILLLFQTGNQIPADNKFAMMLKIDLIRTSCNMIGSMAGYLKRTNTDLNLCIEALFQGLEHCSMRTGGNKELYDKIETMIIKTISILCDNCRDQLSQQYLDTFINVFSSLLQPQANVSNFTRSRLAKSIGYIIECRVQNGPEEQAKYIVQVLDMIETLINSCLTLNPHEQQQQKDYVLNLLSCISEFGSAMLHDEDIENSSLIQQLQQFHEFWQRDPFQCRGKLLILIEKILSNSIYNKDSSFVEICCLILGKSLTLSDEDPYFLKYSMTEIMQIVLKHINIVELTTSLPFFIYLLEKVIIKFKKNISIEEFDYIFDEIFVKFYDNIIIRDPDLLQMMINFIITVLDKSPNLIINCKNWNKFLVPNFIKLLISNEKFTIVAITKFWTKIINNKKYSQQNLQQIRQFILNNGQELVYQVMYGLYHTQRSDLNCYTDLIRALVAKIPMETKNWLINILPTICDKPTINEKFIDRLFVTRGSRAAGNVILNWWLECTSLPTY